MERERIIKLIEQDIKQNQLLNGLDKIGLTDNDRYALSVDLIVADMMGYPETKVPDKWLDCYHKTMLSIPFNLTSKEAHSRAVILFDALYNI